ncbi:uncharacterized protein LOC116204107 [Punica granatum]|uniref:Uncharacterized protein LOC116204107 n=1 Tax=Punica granatum TaxID=22663 RepID=A0A6P8DK83_PUNGR|nr:uncharacterized protein LOC116204107 [Punica granatum]
MEDLYSVVSLRDDRGEYSTDILIEDAKISEVEKKGNITLKEGYGLKRKRSDGFLNLFNKDRTNILYFGKTVEEFQIRLKEAKGDRCLTVLNSEQVDARIKKMKESHRSKIGWIHVGTIQILIKSTFRRNIHCPVRIAVIDNRMTKNCDKILGVITGDLGYGVVKFDVTCNYAVPLASSCFNNSIGIWFELMNKDIMQETDIPFSITYATSYGLSNSHHSVEFINKDKIVIEDLFARTSTRLEFIERLPSTSNTRLLKSESFRITAPISVGKEPMLDEKPQEAPAVIHLPMKSDLDEIKNQVRELNVLTQDLSRRI